MAKVKEEHTPTIDDYLKAAKTIAECTLENTPYVLSLLRQGGFEIPELPSQREPDRPCTEGDFRSIFPEQIKLFMENKENNDRRCVTRIDGTSMLILRELRKQTGLTMMSLASKLIREGAQALGIDTDEE